MSYDIGIAPERSNPLATGEEAMRYELAEAPDATEWMEFDEGLRFTALADYPESAVGARPDPSLHTLFHRTVENQLALEVEPMAWRMGLVPAPLSLIGDDEAVPLDLPQDVAERVPEGMRTAHVELP